MWTSCQELLRIPWCFLRKYVSQAFQTTGIGALGRDCGTLARDCGTLRVGRLRGCCGLARDCGDFDRFGIAFGGMLTIVSIPVFKCSKESEGLTQPVGAGGGLVRARGILACLRDSY